MDRLSRLVLVRHGETTGQSSVRYYGATDVPLSSVGREQVLAARERILLETLEVVWASTLSRAWQAAQILAPDRPIQLEANFREIDFGRWEGLTREEIEAAEPDLFAEWQRRLPHFDYPDGEPREAFRARIGAGLARLRASEARSALVVAHKGVVRTLVELVSGHTLSPEVPDLGGVIHLERDAAGDWTTGRTGSHAKVSEAPSGLDVA